MPVRLACSAPIPRCPPTYAVARSRSQFPSTYVYGWWQKDHTAIWARDPSTTDYVYVWTGRVHLTVRLEEAKACALVLIGVRADGSKELIAIDPGYRESAES